MRNIGRQLLLLSAAALCCSGAKAVYHSNLEVPFAKHVKKASGSHLIKFGAEVEYGFETTKGFNGDSNTVSVAQIYSPCESARNMLIDPNLKQVFPATGYSLTDFPDGLDWSLWGQPAGLGANWGDMVVTAKQRQSALTLWGRAVIDYGVIPGQFFLGMALPFRSVEVSDVTWTDLTDPTADGARNPILMSHLTSKLAAYTKAVGNLDIGDYSKRCMGDAEVYFGWSNSFARGEGAVRKVDVHGSIGVSIPTGRQRDYDSAFSVAFGNDGSWGIPLRVGSDVNLGEDLKIGSSLDLIWFSSKTKVRRLKTDVSQSDYLVLTSGTVKTKPGMTLKMNSHATYRLSESCKFSLAHNYVRHEKDVLSCAPDGYDVAVINSLESLKSWSSQDLTVKAHFEGHYGSTEEDDRDGNEVSFNLFYTLPLSGKRIAKNNIVGAELYFAF